ncbi:MAG TPA: hypothetical protein VN256_13300 [Pyrinomonadaceae bacterium]|nr:hypothetical protein [Pyrinomonadaceae bacterium]
MKQCPACNRTYTDDAQLFCLEDGAQLAQMGAGSAQSFDPNATLALGQPRDTNPPPQVSYGQTPPPAAPPWTPAPYAPAGPAAAQSGSKTWIIIAVAGVAVLALGIVALLAIIGSNNSDGANKNANGGVVSGTTPSTASVLKDDFSTENWPTGEQAYGNFYQDGQYHMKGRPNLYLYMFPLNTGGESLLKYSTRNATVKVTARSVTGESPSHGYGLIIHGKLSPKRNLEGYGFLVYTGDEPKFSIARFAEGVPTDIVAWESSSVIRTGANPNQLEVRAEGTQMSFYVNGQFLKSVTDTANVTDGYVALYTSQTNEVAFDDMEITRK